VGLGGFDGGFGGYWIWFSGLGKKIGCMEIFDFHQKVQNSMGLYLFIKFLVPCPITFRKTSKDFVAILQRQNPLK
jgi:hypothetical protein